MKRMILFFFIFPAHLYAQLCFDFESGDLKTWKQSRDSAWVISGRDVLSGNFSLWHQLDDSVASNDRISFYYDSLILDGAKIVWQFKIRHGYTPSSTNKWAIFLLSDKDESQMMPGGDNLAIVLGVNFTGSDDILRLWKTENGNSWILAETNLNWQGAIGTAAANIRIERSSEGLWEIYLGAEDVLSAAADSRSNWELVGEGQDTGLISPNYFGVYYRYSAKQDLQLWLDDLCIFGSFMKDISSPEILRVEVKDDHTLRVFFSEPVNIQTALSCGSYKVLLSENAGDTSAAIRYPDSILVISENIFELVFDQALASGPPQTLIAHGISDQKGNTSGILNAGFVWYNSTVGDVIINEIMFDPSPEIGLPAYEYIEIYNRSRNLINLEGWTLETGTRMMKFPAYVIQPEQYLLICPKGVEDQYEEDIKKIDLMESKTVLSNEGGMIMLRKRDSSWMDWMEYSPGLHSQEYYAGGGWSLERIDPMRACYACDNWTSSTSKMGGTPGLENSVLEKNPDIIPPELTSIYPAGSHTLVLDFSESMNYDEASRKNAWFVDGGIGIPDSLSLLQPANKMLTLQYQEEFIPGREYSLEIKEQINDCAGIPLEGENIRFALPLQPERSELLISEILFNPLPYCPDFIEIFNPGTKTFDLADLRLANRDPENGKINSVTNVLSGHRLLFPGEYLVFTRDPESLASYFFVREPRTLVKVTDMPSMADDKGTVLILDKYLMVLDELSYDKQMHHPMLGVAEGVSLERISYYTGSEQRTNWHSASSTQDYGTPGRKNSQQSDIDLSSEGFELDPEIFTPDMDGNKDFLLIKYRFQSPGNRARILILDPRGRLIREIGEMQLRGTEGFFTWDGTDRQGRMAKTGIYLVLAEVYGNQGKIYKKTCLLSRGR